MTPTGIDLMMADMARAVDYVGQLLILLYVTIGVCGLIAFAFLLDRCRERRRRQRLDLFYAQMHGVCPDYSKHAADKLSANKQALYSNMPPVVIGGYGQHSFAGTLRGVPQMNDYDTRLPLHTSYMPRPTKLQLPPQQQRISTGNGHTMMNTGQHTSQYGSESHLMHDTIVDPLIGGN